MGFTYSFAYLCVEVLPNIAMKCIDCKVELNVWNGKCFPDGESCVSKGRPRMQLVSSADTIDKVWRCSNCDIARMKMIPFFEHQRNNLDDMFNFIRSIPEFHTQFKNKLNMWEFMRHSLELADKVKHVQSVMASFHQKSYFEDKYKDRPDILQDMLESAEQMWDTDTE